MKKDPGEVGRVRLSGKERKWLVFRESAKGKNSTKFACKVDRYREAWLCISNGR